jgi:cytochrome c peroxidase
MCRSMHLGATCPDKGGGRVGPTGGPARLRNETSRAAALSLAACLALPLVVVAAANDAAPRLAGTEPIIPVSAPVGLDPARVALGASLFSDVRLSGRGDVSCSSCHDLAHGGDDGRIRSPGSDGSPLDFNTPTVFNAALNFRLNWRGNFRDLEAQNEAALLDPRIMGSDWTTLLPRLRSAPEYAQGFRAAYGRPPVRDEVLDALASFQRSLVTPAAPLDRYLAGDAGALAPEERRGFELFKSYGCVSCHQGRNVGGNLFQRFGIFPGSETGGEAEADLGRFTVTGLEADRRVFRVPSLRNVALTAPYLHDGRAATLEEVVAIMGRTQLGVELPAEDVDLIVRFLGTLTGEYGGASAPGAR